MYIYKYTFITHIYYHNSTMRVTYIYINIYIYTLIYTYIYITMILCWESACRALVAIILLIIFKFVPQISSFLVSISLVTADILTSSGLLVYVYVYIYVYLCMYVFKFTYTCFYTYAYIYTYMCMYIYLFVCKYWWYMPMACFFMSSLAKQELFISNNSASALYWSTYIYVYIYIYICIYVYIYIHIYKQ
jgi:hypothetical protein